MVGGGEGSAEGGACLAVAHVAVGEEEAVLGREAVGYLAGLTHETVLQLGGIGDARAVVDDGVQADDAHADADRCAGDALQGAVAQAEGSVDVATVRDVAVCDFGGRGDAHIVADGGDRKAVLGDVLLDELAHDVGELAVMFVLDHEGRQLRVEAVEYHHVAVAHLVEDGDDAPLAEGSLGCRVDAAHVLDEAVVADDAVSERSPADAAVPDEAVVQLNHLVECSEGDFTEEVSLVDIVGAEVVGHRNAVPVLCPAALLLQGTNLFFTKFSHKSIFFLNL